MTGKERILRSLNYENPDKIPMDMWILPAARNEYGERLEELLDENPRDIFSIKGPFDHGFTPQYYQNGWFTDQWGSEWLNIQEGIIGEVKKPIFSDYDKLVGYVNPVGEFVNEWEENKDEIADKIAVARKDGKFIIGGWISLFEKMQYLRGTEELYCDIALDEPEMYDMINLVMDFMREYIKKWLTQDVDAIGFGDDWGSQRSLLINPEKWKELFKPLYKELFNMVKDAGKKVFFHSDGYILDLYPEFIELGVDAINSQVWCMGIDKVAAECVGKITIWGEISRQDTLPNGTQEEIYDCVDKMKKAFFKDGGLIGQSEINKDVPFENIEAFLSAWNR